MGIFSYVKAGKKIFGKKSPTIKSVKPTFPKTKMSQALRDVKMTALKTKGSIKKGSQDMDRDIQKVKSKLGQTMQKLVGEPVTKSGVSKGKDMKKFKTPSLNPKPINKATGGREKKMGFNEYKKSLREKKMGGGMMGRRFGMKKGTPFKKETNVDKIKKTFAPKRKKKFPDLTGDGKVTFADILKGRGVINGKRDKKAVGGMIVKLGKAGKKFLKSKEGKEKLKEMDSKKGKEFTEKMLKKLKDAGFKGGGSTMSKVASDKTKAESKKYEKRAKAASKFVKNQGRKFGSIMREKYMR